MSSQISAIYTAIGALSVSVGAVTPKVYALSALPDTVSSGNLPCRLLLPVAAMSEGRTMNFVTITRTATINWKLTDLMLWQAQAQGRGLEQVAADLVSYMAAYIAAVQGKQALLTNVTTENLSLEPGIFRYPLAGDKWWYGVEAVWTIKEIVS